MTTRISHPDRFYWGDVHVDPVEVDGNLYRPNITDVHRLHFFTLKDQINDKAPSFPHSPDAWHCGWNQRLELLMDLWGLYDPDFEFDPDIVF